MDTPCGFDDSFLQLFGDALAQLPEIFRHGILMLDEISTRQNVRLNRKTYINQKSDHGLVIIFQPVMGSFTQPVSVCYSKGPTTATTLAKLIIQAISVSVNENLNIL